MSSNVCDQGHLVHCNCSGPQWWTNENRTRPAHAMHDRSSPKKKRDRSLDRLRAMQQCRAPSNGTKYRLLAASNTPRLCPLRRLTFRCHHRERRAIWRGGATRRPSSKCCTMGVQKFRPCGSDSRTRALGNPGPVHFGHLHAGSHQTRQSSSVLHQATMPPSNTATHALKPGCPGGSPLALSGLAQDAPGWPGAVKLGPL